MLPNRLCICTSMQGKLRRQKTCIEPATGDPYKTVCYGKFSFQFGRQLVSVYFCACVSCGTHVTSTKGSAYRNNDAHCQAGRSQNVGHLRKEATALVVGSRVVQAHPHVACCKVSGAALLKTREEVTGAAFQLRALDRCDLVRRFDSRAARAVGKLCNKSASARS